MCSEPLKATHIRLGWKLELFSSWKWAMLLFYLPVNVGLFCYEVLAPCLYIPPVHSTSWRLGTTSNFQELTTCKTPQILLWSENLFAAFKTIQKHKCLYRSINLNALVVITGVTCKANLNHSFASVWNKASLDIGTIELSILQPWGWVHVAPFNCEGFLVRSQQISQNCWFELRNFKGRFVSFTSFLSTKMGCQDEIPTFKG